MQSGHLFSAGCPFTICLTQLQHPGRRWQFRHAKLNAGALGGREYIWEGFPPLLFSSSQGVLQNDEKATLPGNRWRRGTAFAKVTYVLFLLLLCMGCRWGWAQLAEQKRCLLLLQAVL